MNDSFQKTAVWGVIVLGVTGLIVGALCGKFVDETAIAVACIGLATTALGILGGLLTAHKLVNGTGDDPPKQPAPPWA